MEIHASSHGRWLGTCLYNRGAGTDLKVFCNPGAKFNEAIRNARPRWNVVTVIIAGGNDVDMSRTAKEIVDGMNIEVIKEQATRRNGFVVWVELFKRYGQGEAFNRKVREVSKRMAKKFIRRRTSRRNVAVLRSKHLGRENFTGDGIHLNETGKARLADKLFWLYDQGFEAVTSFDQLEL